MRRAWGSRLVWGVWTLAVVGLLVSFLPGPVPRLTALPGVADGGFPQRVGFVRDSPPLPANPGRLVMAVDDNNFGDPAWEALDVSGRWWRGGDGAPVLLSGDGRLLVLGLDARSSQGTTYVVRDLVAGTSTPLPHRALRASAVEAGIPRERVHVNSPVAWSPDGRSLLVPLGRDLVNNRAAALVDPATGEVALVALRGEPVGFLPDGRVVAVRITEPESDPSVTVSLADPSSTGAASTDPASTRLRPTTPWAGNYLTTTTTPTGDLLVVEQVPGADDVVRWFDPDTGEERRSERLSLPGSCAVGWVGDDPVFSGKPGTGRQVRVQRVTGSGLTDLVAVHHRMQSDCVTIAAHALPEGPTPMALGTWDATWTWYWRPLVFATLLVAAMVVLLWRPWRRRRGLA